MPKNKNAYLRYILLDHCFRNGAKGRKYTFSQLMDYVNHQLETQGYEPVKKSILYQDIAFMTTEKAPIEKQKEGSATYYRYSDSEYRFGQLPITDEEVSQLETVLSMLRRFNVLPEFGFIEELILKIQQHFRLEFPQNTQPYVHFETNIDTAGKEYLPELLNYIIARQPIEIDYRTFSGANSGKYPIHPYLLKQYNNRWYLIGYNQTTEQLWTLGLERIHAVSPLSIDYIASDTDWEEYFYDVVGISVPKDETLTVNNPLEKVSIRFNAEIAHYIQTKPLHPSQKLRLQPNGEIHCQYSLIPNYELIQTLLQYGEKAEVLAPESLRARMKEKIAQMNGLYR